ncbi:RNA polymerase sigma-70 factor [Parabacteroides johnsonii]|uniref:RNA polymerase sigma-70 factor n=1 Tax=Parabacteroides johnsonii TaxID=387661 RepID=UPI0021CB350F|nr:RNA polymerase sigma-70 factor [Parabacteroides johnsonii]
MRSASDTYSEIARLLYKISENDEVAFRTLFDIYYQKLFHLALHFLKSKELAEEAVSDVFLIIWKKRETLNEIEDIQRYLYTSVKNQALHYIRRRYITNQDYIDLYTIELLPDGNNPEISLLDQEYQKLIQEAILSLPEKCREVFRLVLSDRLKHKEIAQLLNISEKTVEAHITNAYKRIAQYVNKKYSSNRMTNNMISLFF